MPSASRSTAGGCAKLGLDEATLQFLKLTDFSPLVVSDPGFWASRNNVHVYGGSQGPRASCVRRGGMLQALEEEYRHLIGLWKEARTGQGVPTRERFDPMTLRGLVSRVHLLEFEGPDKLIFRLSGTNEQARLGEDPKGEDYLAMVDAPARDYLLLYMHPVLFHPAALVVTTEEIHADGSRIPTRFIVLPLRDTRRGRDQVIALVSEKGPKQHLQATFPVPRDRAWHDEVIAVESVDLGNGIPDIPIYKREVPSA